MGNVTYSDFAKLDLRVGTIESVEIVEGADKLYKLKVNMGKENRTLVAGLRPHYEQADLHGKQIVIIANLEPRRMKGIESKGMLLAAQDNSAVAILRPEKRMENGSKVY
ncbi:MAG: methionine--tRNA ligase subunit beta [Candidatus Altiarchaeota archaeon]|nr:methionine--tRNA ligase subunit beta [Candidatus Altiarchaeota archaeon]